MMRRVPEKTSKPQGNPFSASSFRFFPKNQGQQKGAGRFAVLLPGFGLLLGALMHSFRSYHTISRRRRKGYFFISQGKTREKYPNLWYNLKIYCGIATL